MSHNQSNQKFCPASLQSSLTAIATLACLVISLLFGCVASPTESSSSEILLAEPWLAADALFKSDPNWLGGDGADSIDLGDGRVLWTFGDSWIATSERKVRTEAKLIRNSIAVQTGYDPSDASMQFYWNTDSGGPHSFFPEQNEVWFWPGPGIRIEDTLLIFLQKTRSSSEGLGFAAIGWAAVSIPNPNDKPSEWELTWLDAPENNFDVIVGSASLVRLGDQLYAFGMGEIEFDDIHLVRWPVTRVLQGDLSEPQWWTGSGAGWVSQRHLDKKPGPVIAEGQTDVTVHYEPLLGQYLSIQTWGFGAADLGLRVSNNLTGPWSELDLFYRPEEYDKDGIMIYAARSHPQLLGADLVLTYSTNNLDFFKMLNDASVYYPRFLKGTILSASN